MTDQEHDRHHRAAQVVRAIVVTPPPEARCPPFLLVEIEVDCAVCGGFQTRLAGHHLATLSEALAEIVAEHPDLCGGRANETLKTEWEGRAPGPGKAGMN